MKTIVILSLLTIVFLGGFAYVQAQDNDIITTTLDFLVPSRWVNIMQSFDFFERITRNSTQGTTDITYNATGLRNSGLEDSYGELLTSIERFHKNNEATGITMDGENPLQLNDIDGNSYYCVVNNDPRGDGLHELVCLPFN